MRAANETRKPTATPNGKAAGKAATNNGSAQGAARTTKGNGYWRTTRRKGERVLVDPDGHIYHGTAQEIRDAALMPERRDALAKSIKFARYMAAQFDYTPEMRREYVREKRRDAIHFNDFDELCGMRVHIPPALYLQLKAGSRLVLGDGESFNDFLAMVFDGELDALLDVADAKTGKREIPMTRHERAALDRLRLVKIEAKTRATA